MGFVLSIFYIVTCYLTPETVFGPLAAYRIELILAGLILLVSLPTLNGSIVGKTPQSLALMGLAFSIVLSVLIGEGWAGGGAQAFLLFVPNALGYFLVCLHCNSKKRLQILIIMILVACLFVIAQGVVELRQIPSGQQDRIDGSYFIGMGSEYHWVYRLRGLGEINDPNDFAQLLVCMIPLAFIFWQPKRTLRNITLVVLPVSALLFGTYQTRSRGGLVALLAMVIVAARRRIKTLPALLLAGCLFAASRALDFTGGRDISADAGEDRTELWGQSMQLLKSHPLFGTGFGSLPDHLGHTAHNSVLVCAVELGLFGFYFWCLFLFPTVRDALAVASPTQVSEPQLMPPKQMILPRALPRLEAMNKVEINRLGRLVVLSLTGFLVAGWFLSRAYVMTLFLLGGIAEVVFEMALQRGMISPRLPLARTFRNSGVLAVSLILFMYLTLRTLNLSR